jgi:glycosyltransferase involved in cell wall biosynthesis
MRSPEFHREVADAIIRVWRRRQQFYGYDISPDDSPFTPLRTRAITPEEPGILTWAPNLNGPASRLSTVTEMTEAIGRAYNALTHANLTLADAASDESSRGERLVLWVVAVGDLGGVARHVLDATRARVPGWRIVVLCPEGRLADRLRGQGSAVLTEPISPADSLAGGVTAVRHAERALRPAVVHSHLAYSDFLAADATIGLPAQLVTTEHGIAGNDLVYHGTRFRSHVMELAHAARLRRFDALIAVSQATLDTVRAKWHPPRHFRTVVIPNGVDRVGDALAPPAGRFHVVSLSRLAPEKGLDDLLEAFALVHGAYPEARLTLAGDGPLRADLSQRVTDLNLTEMVSVPGYADAGALLRQADILGQLSTWENCSYTLLDSLAYSLGIVATAVGGTIGAIADQSGSTTEGCADQRGILNCHAAVRRARHHASSREHAHPLTCSHSDNSPRDVNP